MYYILIGCSYSVCIPVSQFFWEEKLEYDFSIMYPLHSGPENLKKSRQKKTREIK